MLVVRTAPVPIQFAIHSSPALGKYTLNNTTVGTVGSTIVPTVIVTVGTTVPRYGTYGTPGVKCTRHPN